MVENLAWTGADCPENPWYSGKWVQGMSVDEHSLTMCDLAVETETREQETSLGQEK